MTTVTAARADLLGAPAPDIDTHLRRHGPLPAVPDLIDLVGAAGLTGRGGAGFPTWRKMAAVAAAGNRAVVVANGVEGEPASAKDRTLLIRAPHLVLDGLHLAARAVGADRAYLYVRSGPGVDSIRRALAERRDGIRTDVVEAPNWFVAGEESAVVAGVEGKRPVPKDKLRRVVESGVHGRPTLVQNVETLAHVARIARWGPAWFRSRGSADEPGTFLATVSGAVTVPGVFEVAHGVPVGAVVAGAGGASEPLQAVLVGGYHGAWLPATALDAPLSRAGLAPFGASPGAGVLVALPASRCGLRESARIASYLAGQSAGQCGPCRNGLPRLAGALSGTAVTEVHRLTALVEGRGACRHPDGTVRFVRSSLHTFAAEVALHRAGRCSEL